MLIPRAPPSARAGAAAVATARRRSALVPAADRTRSSGGGASSTSNNSFLSVQLAQKEAELAGILASRPPPPAAVVGRLRDDILALQAAIDGSAPPPVHVSPEAAERAKARAERESSGAPQVPRLLRPGASAKYVGGSYGGDAAPPLKTARGLPPPARSRLPPPEAGGPTAIFDLALVVGKMVPVDDEKKSKAPGASGRPSAAKV